MFQTMAYSRGFFWRFPDLVPRKESLEEIDSSDNENDLGPEKVDSFDDENVLAKESPARAPHKIYVSPQSLSPPPEEEEEEEEDEVVRPETPPFSPVRDDKEEQSETPELPKKKSARECPADAPRVRYVLPPQRDAEEEDGRERSVTPELPKKKRTMRPSTEKKRIQGKK